jgi:Putative metallopeptidase
MKLIGAFFALTCAAWALVPVTVADAAPAQTNAIEIAYVPPKNSQHQPIYDRLKERRVLERLQLLLSPFSLPSKLTVKVEGCDGETNAWYAEGAVTVCYEYLQYIWQNAFKRTNFADVAQVDVMLGPLFDVFLHEFGHALFDLLDVPLFGREEDAADQVSAYIMLHFGKAEARRLILGTAYAYKIEAEEPADKAGMTAFADEHGSPAQRFYNLMCIAYGADAELFADLVKKRYLPSKRADGCEGEYDQIQKAFQRLISPHIDLMLAREVMDQAWLPDRLTKLPGRPAPKATKTKSSRTK